MDKIMTHMPPYPSIMNPWWKHPYNTNEKTTSKTIKLFHVKKASNTDNIMISTIY